MRWIEPDVRAAAVADIAFAAGIVSKYLFQVFPVEDRHTLGWRDWQSARVAAALMEKEKWLITPKEDTREILTENITREILNLVSGNWDKLEVLDQQKYDDKVVQQNWRLRLVRGIIKSIRTLCVAFSPVIIYFVANKLDIIGDISPPMSGYVKVGLLVWVALSLMFLIDPSLREKISAMRDAVQLLKPGGRKD